MDATVDNATLTVDKSTLWALVLENRLWIGFIYISELHLANFYHRGNTVEHIVYLIDPWVFFCAINNENNNFFLRDEPFELFILWKLIQRGYPSDRIFSYIQMIAKDDWEHFTRYSEPGLSELTLKAINPVNKKRPGNIT
ncbi:MAG: hypothetical protein RBT11_17535 [Desulfobacterales bacterium]|jgi:hypothetical protein|nr:hypothetical protein [Desulfobacterales bacterium]